jgi:hypothetical protein
VRVQPVGDRVAFPPASADDPHAVHSDAAAASATSAHATDRLVMDATLERLGRGVEIFRHPVTAL